VGGMCSAQADLVQLGKQSLPSMYCKTYYSLEASLFSQQFEFTYILSFVVTVIISFFNSISLCRASEQEK
jgi:hypothetical protein